MKKLMIIAAVLLFVASAPACADNDKPIAVTELPQIAQQFIKNHFPKEKVAYAKIERDFLEVQYEVVFTNSSKLEFNKNGEWKEVNCKYSTVPKAIVPAQIVNYISQNYPDANVVKLERNSREYEAKLSNGLELTFDTNFNLIDIDD
ncbi:MAG: PepSY-like domain-containing protein [Bacteroidetes bacterium]|uniref:PepSY-like domain-containing protein n=1 Tax=Candidatus Caccoplasma merdipullorum TaxID=2840718 RepID=A0A9D9H8I8_9BACT|nr:PepSY-like domain-containing protein [Candidatus Caccoplasma merdipullorum]